jgi:hypothetical protein
VILASPWEAESMAVAELLMSQHRWGHTRARRFLAGIPMTETKTIGSMTDRQRRSLAALLEAQTPTGRGATGGVVRDELLVCGGTGAPAPRRATPRFIRAGEPPGLGFVHADKSRAHPSA